MGFNAFCVEFMNKSWPGASAGPDPKKSETCSVSWIVSIPIKYRNCSFRIVGYPDSVGNGSTLRDTYVVPPIDHRHISDVYDFCTVGTSHSYVHKM
jgi:hypothetical protein